jgi:hypothetical protein
MKSVIKGKSKLMSEPEPKFYESRSRSGNKKFRLHNTASFIHFLDRISLSSWVHMLSLTPPPPSSENDFFPSWNTQFLPLFWHVCIYIYISFNFNFPLYVYILYIYILCCPFVFRISSHFSHSYQIFSLKWQWSIFSSPPLLPLYFPIYTPLQCFGSAFV